jgi:hypothetical protein
MPVQTNEMSKIAGKVRGKFTSRDKQFHLSDISAHEIGRLPSPFDYHHKKQRSSTHNLSGRHRRSEDLKLYAVFNLVARWRWVGNAMPRLFYLPKTTRYPLYRKLGVLQGVKDLTPTRIRSPDRPARSKSLYRLRYPGLSLHTIYFCGAATQRGSWPPHSWGF